MNDFSLTLLLVLPLGIALVVWFGRQAWQQRSEATRANARLAALVTHSNDLIMILDRDGLARYVSPSVERICGFPAASGIGQHFHGMSHRDDHPQLDAAWQRLLTVPGTIERVRYRTVHATRKWIMVDTSATAHFDTPGIEGVLLMVRDISDQVQAETQLLSNKETLYRAQAIAHIGSWSLDINDNQLIWSDETYRIFGIPIGTPMTMERFIACIHPDDRDMVLEEWNAALQGAPYDVGHRIMVGDEILWVQEKADLIFDPEGRLLGGTGTVQDVTAQHVAATQLAELLDFSEKIIAESPVGIAVYRADGPCVMANEAMARIFNIPLEQLRLQNYRRLPAWRLLGLLDTAMEALQLAAPVRKLVHGPSDAGEPMALDVEFAPIMRHGQQHLMLQAKDISEFQAIENALKEAMRMTEEASRAKSEFLANMSHEIRTPMNAVLGLAQLALDEARDPTLVDHLKQMYESANLLLGIINDILDYSKIEAGRLNLETREFNTSDIAANIRGMFQLPCRQKGIQLNVTIGDDVPPRLNGDSLRLGQVLTNLVGNAVKFTESGEVTLEIARCSDPSPAGHARLRFSVSDTGVGMDESALSRLFQPFMQADGSITRRYGGTGLGLTISRRLVLLMGGDIEVSSTAGRGSCFHFDIDLALPTTAPLATTAPLQESAPTGLAQMAYPIAGARVLLVEDDKVNQRVARGLLERAGLQVSVADHGGEALDHLSRGDFDAVLMDLQMPEVDGFEATRRIRAEARWQSLPIIAVTAGAMVHDREKCLAAGMNDFVVKPVQPPLLIDALLRHIPARHTAPMPSTAVPPAPTFELNTPRLIATLQALQQRIQDNEFIASSDLGELRELTRPLPETRGAVAARIEAAISRYEYTTAKTLIDSLLNSLQAGDLSRTA